TAPALDSSSYQTAFRSEPKLFRRQVAAVQYCAFFLIRPLLSRVPFPLRLDRVSLLFLVILPLRVLLLRRRKHTEAVHDHGRRFFRTDAQADSLRFPTGSDCRPLQEPVPQP